jgi:hypothetical protein
MKHLTSYICKGLNEHQSGLLPVVTSLSWIALGVKAMSENIKLMIAFKDPDLDADERDEEAQKLLDQMREIEEVEAVDRVFDPNPPEGNKAVGGFLLGLLTAEVNPANAGRLMTFLGDRLSGKVIELDVEANGKKLKVKARSREELTAAIQAAQDFVAV